MAKKGKGVEYRVIRIEDRAESVEGELNRAAQDGFKVAGTTAKAVIMERKIKAKDEDDKDRDKDDKDDKGDEDDEDD